MSYSLSLCEKRLILRWRGELPTGQSRDHWRHCETGTAEPIKETTTPLGFDVPPQNPAKKSSSGHGAFILPTQVHLTARPQSADLCDLDCSSWA
jgi:hypothetical protein